MKKFRLLLFIIITWIAIFVNNKTYASDSHTYTSDDVNVIATISNSTIEFKFLARYYAFSDDYMDNAKIYFTVGNGSEFQFGGTYTNTSSSTSGALTGTADWGSFDNNYTFYISNYANYSITRIWNDANYSDHNFYVSYYVTGGNLNSWWGQTINVRFAFEWNGTPATIYKTVTLPSFPDNVNNLTTTTDTQCNGINLTWSEPSQSFTGSYGVADNGGTNHTFTGSTCYSVGIYRNDTYLATQSWGTGNYTDNTAVKGVTYNYKIQTIYSHTGLPAFNMTGNFTNETQGRSIANPPPPNNLTASNSNCDGSVNLAWNFSSSVNNATSFNVFRQTPTFGTGQNILNEPFDGSYGYTRMAALYTATEIGAGSTISNMLWYVYTASAISIPIKIYLKPTTANSTTVDTWANYIAGATLVYSGNYTFSSTGWNTINITDFNYTGNNLMVLCEANYGGGGAGGSYHLNFLGTSLSNMSARISSVNTPPTTNLSVYSIRPNLKFTPDQTLTSTGSNTTFSDTPSLANFLYTYSVAVVDQCGVTSNYSSTTTGKFLQAPNAPSGLTLSNENGNVRVNWTDNSTDETGFILQRTPYGGTSSVFNLNAGVTTYLDNGINNCINYTYEILAKNSCATSGVASGSPQSIVINNDLSKVFDATHKLKTSKGFYNNRVELIWTNNEANLISGFIIYRKVYGAKDSLVVATLTGAVTTYNDNTTDAGTLYQYSLLAYGMCNGITLYSSSVSDIGFRSPVGIVSGHIDYSGGIAVNGASVLVNSVSGTTGTSLSLDGVNDYVDVPVTDSLKVTNAITIEAWVRPEEIRSNNPVLSLSTAYQLYLVNKQPVFKLNNGDMTLQFNVDTFDLSQWRHVAATYNGTVAKLYVNGKLKASQNYTSPINYGASPTLTTLTVGAGTTATDYPLSPDNGFTRNASLYTNAEVGSNGIIAGLEWNVNATNAGVTNCLEFNGNNYVQIPDNNALDLTTNYTLEAWIKPSSLVALGGIISKYQSPSSNGYLLRLGNPDPSAICFDEMTTANGIVAAGNWYHIAAVKNGATRTLYVNGNVVALTGTPLSVASNSDFLSIGIDYNTLSRCFNGSIDEVRVWNVARTQAQIQASKNVELNGTEAGLVAYYNFNQGVASGNNSAIFYLTDKTQNNFTGLLYSFALTGSTSNWIASTNGVTPTSTTSIPLKIYLKTTTASTLTSDTWANLISGATLVYDATNQFNTTGWNLVNITQFNYSGSNLLVLTEANVGNTGTSLYPTFNSSSGSNNSLGIKGNYTAPTGNLTLQSTRPNIQIGIYPSFANSDLYLGRLGSNYFKGEIDELRISNIAKSDADIARDYIRIMNGNEPGTIASYSFDEGVGSPYVFDRANRNGTYYVNTGTLMSGTTFSTIIPTSSQLGYTGYTNSSGDYTISGIRYNGAGQNFQIVPVFGVHSFTPSSQVLFIGDGSATINNENFSDISSFTVTGSVTYSGTSCPSAGVMLYIDGVLVLKNNLPVTTATDGTFTISVPIGEHQISVGKASHIFSAGIFPSSGYYNFQAPVSGIQFIDSTFIKVVGRVVGGTREGNKFAGVGLSKNNIGQAKFSFVSTLLSGCSTIPVTTNNATGEYTAYLLPLVYQIKNLGIASNSGIIFGTQNNLDLTNIPQYKKYTDTIYIAGTHSVQQVDTISFHTRLDFIYRSIPQLTVTDSIGTGTVKGATSFNGALNNGTNYTVDLTSNQFPLPVFISGKIYNMRVHAFEQYVNNDATPVYDNVPIQGGVLTITNQLSTSPTSYNVQLGNDTIVFPGDTLLYFAAGTPNMQTNLAVPQYSFAKTLNISLSAGTNTVNWQPITSPPSGGDNYFRGIVLGIQATSKSFITKGPQVVDYVLRDPPGSYSTATRQVSTQSSYQSSYDLALGENFDVERKVALGPEFAVGVGTSTEIKTTNDVTLGVTVNSQWDGNWTEYDETTVTKAYSTDANPELVGAQSDIFLGSSKNMGLGTANNLKIIPVAQCGIGGNVCYGNSVNGYQLCMNTAFTLSKDSSATSFIYTQDFIENTLVPNLLTTRSSLFNTPFYVSKLASSDPNYGANNDDSTVFSKSVIASYGANVIYNGPSYKWNKTAAIAADSTAIDQIRFDNQQISLWQKALRDNEQIKANLIKQGVANVTGAENVSYSGGLTYTNTIESTHTSTYQGTFSLFVSASAATTLGFTSGGVGAVFTGKLELTVTNTWVNTTTTTTSNSVAYTLQDDPGDYMSVDIFPGDIKGGPIFYLRGGATSCPYEGPESSHYLNPPVTLSAGTLQIEKPKISVVPSLLANIPADQSAAFTLTLSNNTEAGQTVVYALNVVEALNPNGAIIEIDGQSPNRTFEIPAGSSIQKIITINKGATPVYNYDNLVITLHSVCEGNTISDTATFSAHFIPTCTNVEFLKPVDKWVLNNSFNDTLPIILGNYDFNFAGLDYLWIQYKPTNQSTWQGLKMFYKDTTGHPNSLPISQSTSYTTYLWDVSQIVDGTYDLRVVSQCDLASNASPDYTGIMDRINPQPFGTMLPANGILGPGDNIMISFNEPVNSGAISLSNFSITGVTNQTAISNNVSLHFDGVSNYLQVEDGILLNQSFTIECWVQRNSTGAETFFSQGINAAQSLSLGFNQYNDLILTLAGATATSTNAITDQEWHYIACSFNKATGIAQIFIDGRVDNTQTIVANYTQSGKIFIGKSSYDAKTFKGNLHELRLWNIALSLSDLVPRMNIALTGNEFNLLNCWQMTEATGTITTDIAQNRIANIYGATWAISPSGRGFAFNGINSYLTYPTTTVAFSSQMNFSIEFWFKAGLPADTVGLFTNGKGDDNTTWAILATPDGKIIVKNNGYSFYAVPTNTFDNNWHQFALVVNRLGGTNAFLDGVQSNSTTSSKWYNFGAAKFWIGCRGWMSGATENRDGFFLGDIDEVRVWNLARTQTQIKRDMNYRLNGTESGLLVYLPFEQYTQNLGVYILTTTLQNIVNGTTATVFNGATYTTETPTLKMQRPVQNINFTFLVNVDKIILQPTEAPSVIENCIFDISANQIQDLNGNYMQSPATWTALVRQNPVRWMDTEKSFTKQLYNPMTFTSTIENLGGLPYDYQILNLPSWLTVSSPSGTINPLATQDLTFTIASGANIGTYSSVIYLRTSFGYDEKLVIDLRVYAPEPNWTVNPSNFQYSMSIIGQVQIDGIISSDVNDKVGAFVNGQCRGTGYLQYISAIDKYEVFLDVYSNILSGEPVSLHIWDASAGMERTEVTPVYTFNENDVFGSPSNPQMLTTSSTVLQNIPLHQGWTWISLNVLCSNMATNNIMASYTPNAGDIVKGQNAFEQYDAVAGWIGTLPTMDNLEMYKVNIQTDTVIQIVGTPLLPSNVTIPLQTGWNWIGYSPSQNLTVNQALSNFTATTNNIIKSQHSFAIYTSGLGWLGTLQYMQPGVGYMLQASNTANLVYPTIFKSGEVTFDKPAPITYANWNVNANTYQYSMSVVAQVVGDNMTFSENDILTAFSGSEFHAIAKPMKVQGSLLYFLTIYSNNLNATVNNNFKLYNDYAQIVYDASTKLNFTNDALVGNINAPFQIKLSANTSNVITIGNNGCDLQVSPNPFANTTEISLTVSSSQNVAVDIYDIFGNSVATILNENNFIGQQKFVWGNNVSSGVYILKLRYGTNSKTIKLVKTN